MKTSHVLLALSLAANVACVAVFFVRPAPIPPKTMVVDGRFDTAHLAVLGNGDLAQLQAAGVPADLAADLVIGRAYGRLQARDLAFREDVKSNGKYWQIPLPPPGPSGTPELDTAAMETAQREFADVVLTTGRQPVGTFDRRYDYFPAAKREALRRLDENFQHAMNAIGRDIFAISLPSDGERMRSLFQDHDRALAALLSPEEVERYLLLFSPTALKIRAYFGAALQTEDDYRKIFALQKRYDDQFAAMELPRYGTNSRSEIAAKVEAQGKLQSDFRQALGEEKFAALQRAVDQEYRTLIAIAKRLDLPANTYETVFAIRKTCAIESQKIRRNPAYTAQERFDRLKQLAGKASAELVKILGKEGADAYGKRANWLRYLDSGEAFSTDPKDAPDEQVFIGNAVYRLKPIEPAPPPRS